MSVCMIAYNHEQYIGQAVDSVLAQNTAFPVRLVVGDDCSTDGTREILRRRAQRHPDRTDLLLRERNLGMMGNFVSTLAACTGRYVALCEGDDYWLDVDKLQGQVDYLEAHPECAVSFHNAYVEDEAGQRTLFHERPPGTVFIGRDLLQRWLVPTASAVFRNPGLTDLPAFFHRATHGDLSLFLWLAQGGELHYLDRTMSVYRKHAGGAMNTFRGTAFNQREIAYLREMNAYFEGRYSAPLARRTSGLHRSNALQHAAAGRRAEAVHELASSWRSASMPTRRALRESAQVLLAVVAPRLYRALRSNRGRGPAEG